MVPNLEVRPLLWKTVSFYRLQRWPTLKPKPVMKGHDRTMLLFKGSQAKRVWDYYCGRLYLHCPVKEISLVSFMCQQEFTFYNQGDTFDTQFPDDTIFFESK